MWLGGWIGEPRQVLRSGCPQDLLKRRIMVPEEPSSERHQVLRPLAPAAIGDGGMTRERRTVRAQIVLPALIASLHEESPGLVVWNCGHGENAPVGPDHLEQGDLARLRPPGPEAGQEGRTNR